MALRSRLTERLGIRQPIASASADWSSGGAAAAGIVPEAEAVLARRFD